MTKKAGSRISDLRLMKSGAAIDPGKDYVVAGWASINQGTEGPAIWDVVAKHIEARKTVSTKALDSIKVVGGE